MTNNRVNTDWLLTKENNIYSQQIRGPLPFFERSHIENIFLFTSCGRVTGTRKTARELNLCSADLVSFPHCHGLSLTELLQTQLLPVLGGGGEVTILMEEPQ